MASSQQTALPVNAVLSLPGHQPKIQGKLPGRAETNVASGYEYPMSQPVVMIESKYKQEKAIEDAN